MLPWQRHSLKLWVLSDGAERPFCGRAAGCGGCSFSGRGELVGGARDVLVRRTPDLLVNGNRVPIVWNEPLPRVGQPWFKCQRCRRRCKHIYLDELACRTCLHLDGNIRVPVHTVTTLERQEVDRVGQRMARDRSLTFMPSSAGEYVSGRLAGVASLVSGRFAMIENGARLPARALATPPREAYWPAHHRPAARRRRYRVDLGKEPRAQFVAQPRRRRACSHQLGRTAAALKRRACRAPASRGWRP